MKKYILPFCLLLLGISVTAQRVDISDQLEKSVADSSFVMTDSLNEQQYITVSELRNIITGGTAANPFTYYEQGTAPTGVNGDMWKEPVTGFIYINNNGAWILIAQDRTVLMYYDDDAHAAANGIPLDGWYKVSANNKIGLKFGMETQRKY